ncbi:MAG: HupE/UreJ family protein [Sphingobacteriaceae bacterium]|nr:MAG: HupE/UreJ family protein [Sphingobacteriaceae bacterium]
MPNTLILLDIRSDKVSAELQLPLNELELAFGHDVNRNSNNLINRLGTQLKSYLLQHIKVFTPEGKPWTVTIDDMQVQPVQESTSGPYKELTVQVTLVPPANANTRQFNLNYDAIIHQVVSHYALVSIRQDWDNGSNPEHPYEVGVIGLDVKSNTIKPLAVNIQQGSLWRGFTSMVNLGVEHIKEGTDHLLFLLTLLLPAPLLVNRRRWAEAGSTRYSLVRIIKIVTAFTIGHSITLLLGATGMTDFPAQPIEILIAVSILISAIHAIRPIFPGKEVFIAAGFGLIHGMAFATTLVNLNLDAGRMALSIFGFNLGIELMQLLVVAITIPWLIILSRSLAIYNYVRITGAVTASIAAIGWIVERIASKPNLVSTFVLNAADYAKWLIVLLTVLAFLSFLSKSRKAEV